MPTLRDIDFADENPATRAYQTQVLFGDRDRAYDIQAEGNIEDNRFQRAANPGRLRTIDAHASTAATNAEFARPLAEAHLRSSDANATNAEVGAEFARPNAEVALRQHTAAADNAEMQRTYRALDYLKNGNIDAARTVDPKLPQAFIENAESRQALIESWEQAKQYAPHNPNLQFEFMRGKMTDMAKQAQARAQAQQPQPQQFDTEGGEASASQPAPAVPPVRAPGHQYAVPEGVPPPPTTDASASQHNIELLPATRTGEDGKPEQGYIRHDRRGIEPDTFVSGTTIDKGRGGAGGSNSVFQQKLAVGNALYGAGTKEAADYASGKRTLTEPEIAKSALSMARAEANGNAMLKFNQAKYNEFVAKRAPEIANQIRSGFGATPAPATTPIPTTPAPTPAPQANASWPVPNGAQIARLKGNPRLAEDFDQKFGPGAAARYLGVLSQ